MPKAYGPCCVSCTANGKRPTAHVVKGLGGEQTHCTHDDECACVPENVGQIEARLRLFWLAALLVKKGGD
jgi:hypothetical protein